MRMAKIGLCRMTDSTFQWSDHMLIAFDRHGQGIFVVCLDTVVWKEDKLVSPTEKSLLTQILKVKYYEIYNCFLIFQCMWVRPFTSG